MSRRAGITSPGTCIPVPDGAEVEVGKGADIPVEMGVCKTVWTTDDAPACEVDQYGCPTLGLGTACDGDENAWCMVDEENWCYCALI